MRVMPEDVNTYRGVAVWVLRSISVALLAVGTYLVLKKILFGIGVGDPQMIYRVWEDVGEGHSFYRGLAMLLTGAGLGLASSRLARWAIAVPPDGCPRCGYGPGAQDSARCPECGLDGRGTER